MGYPVLNEGFYTCLQNSNEINVFVCRLSVMLACARTTNFIFLCFVDRASY